MYEGEYRGKYANGFGRSICANASYYIGDFKDGQLHGHGMLVESDGTVHEGIFEKHRYVGPANFVQNQ